MRESVLNIRYKLIIRGGFSFHLWSSSLKRFNFYIDLFKREFLVLTNARVTLSAEVLQ